MRMMPATESQKYTKGSLATSHPLPHRANGTESIRPWPHISFIPSGTTHTPLLVLQATASPNIKAGFLSVALIVAPPRPLDRTRRPAPLTCHLWHYRCQRPSAPRPIAELAFIRAVIATPLPPWLSLSVIALCARIPPRVSQSHWKAQSPGASTGIALRKTMRPVHSGASANQFHIHRRAPWRQAKPKNLVSPPMNMGPRLM
jgi:hypothetical protein